MAYREAVLILDVHPAIVVKVHPRLVDIVVEVVCHGGPRLFSRKR